MVFSAVSGKSEKYRLVISLMDHTRMCFTHPFLHLCLSTKANKICQPLPLLLPPTSHVHVGQRWYPDMDFQPCGLASIGEPKPPISLHIRRGCCSRTYCMAVLADEVRKVAGWAVGLLVSVVLSLIATILLGEASVFPWW
jgi:hypothetical protein